MLPAKDADGIDDNGQKVVETTFWHCCQIVVAERSRRDKLSGPGFAVVLKDTTLLNVDGEHLRFNYLPTRKWTKYAPNQKNDETVGDRVESNTQPVEFAMASRRKDSSS
jgi:hypothetical protein